MDNKKSDSERDIFEDPKLPEYSNNSFSVNTQSMPLGSRSVGSSVVISNKNNNKVDSLKTWSVSTLKCTKQIIQEKLGKVSKTVDLDLEEKIEHLRIIQKKYHRLHETVNRMFTNFQLFLENQRSLAEQFSEMSQQQPQLMNEFSTNSELQKHIVKQGDLLSNSLSQFVESLNTLVTKSMTDTLLTIQKYEKSRLEFDAYRHEVEELNRLSKSTDPNSITKAMELKEKMNEKQKNYNQLRSDVDVKIQFLEENKNRVLHRQLVLFNSAIISYYNGNTNNSTDATNKLLSHLTLTMKNANFDPPCWFEQNAVNDTLNEQPRSKSFNNFQNHKNNTPTKSYTPH